MIIIYHFYNISTIFFESSASDYYREESVQAATKDKETASDNTGSGKGVSENTGKSGARGDVQRQMVVERYLSVSYPLPRIKVTSPYGYRKDPFTGKRKFHGGIDLQARGDKVLAMMAGTVVKVGQDKTSGKYVTLQHGNCMISYCHLSKILVARGTAVRPRDAVGITGSTGRSTGEHLHITCRLNLLVVGHTLSGRQHIVNDNDFFSLYITGNLVIPLKDTAVRSVRFM